MEYYAPQVEAVFATTEHEERIAIPVERVSAAILHALTAPKPRRRYLLGSGARSGSIVALLPAALRERAMRASMGLP